MPGTVLDTPSVMRPDAMRTPAEIAESISQHIASIYLRPAMHVGSTEAVHSANSLDSLLFALHFQWAFVHEREREFRDIATGQHQATGCSNFGFADAFRRIHKGDCDEEASKFVMRNWREISQALEICLEDRSGSNAMDAEF